MRRGASMPFLTVFVRKWIERTPISRPLHRLHNDVSNQLLILKLAVINLFSSNRRQTGTSASLLIIEVAKIKFPFITLAGPWHNVNFICQFWRRNERLSKFPPGLATETIKMLLEIVFFRRWTKEDEKQEENEWRNRAKKQTKNLINLRGAQREALQKQKNKQKINEQKKSGIKLNSFGVRAE